MIRQATRTKLALWLTLLSGLAATALALAATAQAAFDEFDIGSATATRSTAQAGAHPDFTTVINIKTDPASAPDEDGDLAPYAITRDLSISLPAGMTANPKSVASCSALQFSTILFGGECPRDSQVGVTVLHLYGLPLALVEPVYNLERSGGDVVARLGFYGYNTPVFINAVVRSEDDYGVTANGEGFYSGYPLVSAETTFWGIPADSSHDTERMTAREVGESGGLVTSSPPRPSGLARLGYMINPTNCAPGQTVDFAVDSYQEPGVFKTASAPLEPTTGCETLAFTPGAQLRPTSSEADSPSGMDVDLSIDQATISQPQTVAPAHLKKVIVRLPQGMSLNPAAAGGLSGCTSQQIGLISDDPIRFNTAPPSCPDGANVGTAEIVTPLLEGPIHGSLFVAAQNDNPFHSLLAGYLYARGEGVTVKLAGRFDLDPQTGQITATFDENPQQPFSNLSLHFKGGERGVLVTPPECGRYKIETELSPWSAIEPDNPAPSEIVHRNSFFDVTSGPGGGPCPNPPGFSPSFEAGTANPAAAAYSPLLMRASRPDGSQVIDGIDLQLPPGLIGKLAGLVYCPDANLAAADQKSGTTEIANPSCPANSRIGSIDAGAGAGESPLHVQGEAYLAGPYKGAPLSLAVITPAVAGPFDLGTVAVRAALYVDPVTAQIHAVSDRLPTILEGVPLHLRTIAVNADRPNFTKNPTSCDPMALAGTLTSLFGSVPISDRFQVAGCGELPFKPKLTLRLKGKARRGAYQQLTAVLKAKPGEANIRKVSVALPRAEFLAQEHINTICTRVQFAANACPAGSIYGHARAFTPLLDQPLEGPVYLRANPSHELPDLVAALRGQIDIELAGQIDSINEGIRTTFTAVPDAPVSKFVLKMGGGKKSLLVNSRNICRSPSRVTIKMTGQSGLPHNARPILHAAACKGSKKKGQK